jgi:hypothetical protein
MDNAARTRQRVLALFLPIAAVLYISAEALSPKGTDQVITTTATALKVVSIAARHPTQLYAAGSLALLGLGALAIGLYVAEIQSSGGPVVVLYMLPFAAAMILLAARIWQAAALPASHPQPEPASVPA